jgi:hypothetical protein
MSTTESTNNELAVHESVHAVEATNGNDPTHAEPASGEATSALSRPEENKVADLALEFADLYSQYLEAPRGFFYFAFLTYVGALVSRMVTLASELDVQPRSYTVLLGKSGDTRKTTALRKTEQFFKDLIPVATPWRTVLGAGSAEGLAKDVNGEHPAILHLDEFKSFVDKARIDGSVLLPMVGSLFERSDYGNTTKKDTIEIKDGSLSLLAASTVETYSTMFSPQFQAIGFLNRLWLITGESDKSFPVPRKIPADQRSALQGRVKDRLAEVRDAYLRNGSRPVEYSITPGAQELFAEWYTARSGSVFETRLDTYGHRLALLLAVVRGKSEIDEAIMRDVVGMLRVQLTIRREYDPVDAGNVIAALEEDIRRKLHAHPGALPERGTGGLKHRCHATRHGLFAWQKALGNLVKAGKVEPFKAGYYRLASTPTPTPGL